LPATLPIIFTVAFFLLAIGTVVGSFINVCVYRIPMQKSVIWPSSTCPRCWATIPARDNIPIVGWIVLGGRCRSCRDPISARYPLVEALVGALFVALLVVDVVLGQRTWAGEIPLWLFTRGFYHMLLVALLVAGSFIDFDLTIIPDQITVTGMILAIALGAWFPWIRPDPSSAATAWAGLWVGITGLLVGGGLTWFVRLFGSLVFRREAMGFGDVTLMAMIGAFLGWQAAVLTFFLAPFFGIAHALWKLTKYVGKRLSGGQLSTADREIPFGPYLSMAAVALVLAWPWLWPLWGSHFFGSLGVVFLWMLGLEK
jgi:leader peptidase (prepilin peptidase) / N-methyltransferase